MKNSGKLLDDLAEALACPYLSDLSTPSCLLRLPTLLKSIPPENYSAAQWNDASAYLLQRPADFPEASQAHAALLAAVQAKKSAKKSK